MCMSYFMARSVLSPAGTSYLTQYHTWTKQSEWWISSDAGLGALGGTRNAGASRMQRHRFVLVLPVCPHPPWRVSTLGVSSMAEIGNPSNPLSCLQARHPCKTSLCVKQWISGHVHPL